MMQLNLFLGLLEVVTQLLEVGADSTTTYEARLRVDSLVENFEESHGVEMEEGESIGDEVEQSPLTAILYNIATKERTLPQELKEYFLVQEYFLVSENPQENEVFFRGLPSLPEASSPDEAKLRVEAFALLNDLLKVGLTSCSVHKAHMQLDDLLAEYEQRQEDMEDRGMDDFNSLNHLFPNLESQLNALTVRG